MNQYRSHLKWCVYFTPPTTNKTTPPINLGVWLVFNECFVTIALEVVPFMSLRDKLTKHVCGEGYYDFL